MRAAPESERLAFKDLMAQLARVDRVKGLGKFSQDHNLLLPRVEGKVGCKIRVAKVHNAEPVVKADTDEGLVPSQKVGRLYFVLSVGGRQLRKFQRR